MTRGQQKQIDSIKDEKPPAKKAKMARDNTMVNTAKVWRQIYLHIYHVYVAHGLQSVI